MDRIRTNQRNWKHECNRIEMSPFMSKIFTLKRILTKESEREREKEKFEVGCFVDQFVKFEVCIIACNPLPLEFRT